MPAGGYSSGATPGIVIRTRLATFGGQAALLGIEEAGLADALGAEQRRLGQRDGHVLEDLHGVVGGDAAVDHAVGAGARDLLPERAVVGSGLVDAVVALDLQAAVSLAASSTLLGQARRRRPPCR